MRSIPAGRAAVNTVFLVGGPFFSVLDRPAAFRYTKDTAQRGHTEKLCSAGVIFYDF
jgi:hypothetical protein